MLQAGRSRNAGEYRFGFNGMENDNKKGGLGEHVDFGARGLNIWTTKFYGITTPGSNTQRGLFIIGPSSKDRTLAHEMLTHGGGLEHINVSTSLLYNAYRNFAEEYCAISDNTAGIKELENNNYNLLNNVTNTEDNSMPSEIASFPNLPSKLVRQGLELVHQQYHYPGDGYTILPEQIDQLKANIVHQTPSPIPSLPSPTSLPLPNK
jgi:hypothetical protein